MGELEDKLNAILSSPEEMGKMLELAGTLSQSLGFDAPPKQDTEDSRTAESVLRAVGKLRDGGGDSVQLLSSLARCMKGERREDLERAVRILRIYKVAKTVFEEMGGEEHL